MMVIDGPDGSGPGDLDGVLSISFGPDTDPAMKGTLGPLGSPTGKGSDAMGINDLRSILGGATGNNGPPSNVDPFMQDIVDAMDASMAQELLPLSHTHGELPCSEDEKKFCPPSERRRGSTLHCLGQHGALVSEKCRKDVKLSLPFNCAQEISGGCDGVDESIISCLSGLRSKGKTLSSECQSCLEVTKGFIRKANTLPTTVTSFSPLNTTHVSQTKTMRHKDHSTSSLWPCPSKYMRDP